MTTQQQRRLIPWFLFNVFLLLSIGILITGFLIYQKQEQRLKSDTHRSLAAIADLKVNQIVQWRYDRIGDGNLIRENVPLIRQIAEFYKTGDGTKRKLELINWMNSFQKHYGYGNILLVDTKGKVQLSADVKDNSIGSFARAFLPEIVRNREVIFTDLHKSEEVAHVHIDMLVPLISLDDKDSSIFGIVLLRIDPNIELFPLVQSWPTSRRTSETLLLEREGNEVVFLNELRYEKNTTLSLRLPISDQQLPAAMAARGIEGTVEGIDYRNIPVLAALRKIPNSQWFMVAKVDREEIYAPLWYQAWIVGGAVFLLIIATGSIIGFWWRHQRARFYRQQYEAELERKALVTHYDYFVKYANDIILLLHKDGKIVEANERACISYGYTREEIIQLNIRDLRSPKTRAIVGIQMQQVDEQNGMIFETEHLRKDGTMFPVEVSSRVFEVEGTKFYQSIIRDITERNRLNEILEKERQELKLIIDSSPIIVFYKDKEGRFIRVNRTFAEALQIPEENFVGKTVFDIYSQKIAQSMNDDDQEILKSGRPKLNIIEQYESASGIRWVQTDKIPICDKNGIPIGLIGFAQDITERKQAEEALRESEEMYKSLVKASPESITITDLSGKITYVSQRTLELHGSKSAEELIGKSAFELVAPEDQKEAIVNLQKTMEEGIVRGLEYTMLRKNGIRFAAELSAASIKDISGKPKAFIATVRDITERKRSEKALHESESRYRELANSITDVFFAMDAELKYTYWNSASEKLTGIPAQNAIGKHLYEIFPDTPEIKNAEEIYRDVLKTRQFRSFINSYQKGSQTIFFEISVYPSKEGISVFTKDITERKMAAEALRESEERYKRITQAITDYIYTVYIKNGNVVETRHGEGCNAVTGYSSEEYAADPNLWYRMILDEDRSSVNDQSQRLLAGEDVPPLEHRIVRKDGTIRWIRNTSVPHYNEEGELLSYDGLIQDINERKQAELARMQAEESLRESQQMLQTVLNTIPVRVFWKDVNSKYLGCNLPFALDGGFHSPEDLIGKDDFQAVWKNQAELYRADDRFGIRNG